MPTSSPSRFPISLGTSIRIATARPTSSMSPAARRISRPRRGDRSCRTTSWRILRRSVRAATVTRVRREKLLWLIIGYKLGKGALWLLFAAMIMLAMRFGLEDRLLGFASELRHHSRAWSLELARLIVRAANRRGLWTITVA